jgi:hypothetical protein
VGRES